MALTFELNRPGITSVSIDGIEHKVDPATGYLTVDVMTPNLMRELTTHHGAVQIDPNAQRRQQMPPRGQPAPLARPGVAQPGAAPGGGSGLSAARMAYDASTEGAGLKEANQLPRETDNPPGPEQVNPSLQSGQQQTGQQQTGMDQQTGQQQRSGNLPGQLTAEEEAERQALFVELDEALGNRVDRRRSLNQLREMKEKLPKS